MTHAAKMPVSDEDLAARGEEGDIGSFAPVEIGFGRFEGSAGFLVRLVQIRLFGAFFERFGAEGLRPGEFSVLVAINENPGVRQGVLANALMITRSNMAKMIRSLEERGLVLRDVPSSDRRAVELRLTSNARSLVDEFAPKIVEFDRETTWALSDEEHATFLRLLRKIAGRSDGGPLPSDATGDPKEAGHAQSR